jgi:hypothetical protein
MADQTRPGAQTGNTGTGRGKTAPQFPAGDQGPRKAAGTMKEQTAGESSSGEGLTDKASDMASGLMAQVRERASDQVASQKDRAADGLGSVAQALRKAGNELRSSNTGLASYADRAVDELEHLSDRIREKDLAEVVSDLETFARRRPAAFLGGSFLMGLGLARLLKSSSDRRRASTRRHLGAERPPRATGMATPPGSDVRRQTGMGPGAGTTPGMGAGAGMGAGMGGSTGATAGAGTTGTGPGVVHPYGNDPLRPSTDNPERKGGRS